MFRWLEIFNTILSLLFNILAIVGIYQGVEIISKIGFEISPNLLSTILLITLLYFLSVLSFLIIQKFVTKNKLTEKNTKPEIKALVFMLYLVMGATAFPIWFYSTPTNLPAIGQLFIIILGIIMCTFFIALLTEVIGVFSDGKHLKNSKRKQKKD